MDKGNRELHFTYLDTVGRPVVVAHKTNLVEQHIQDFEVCTQKMTVNKTIVEIKYIDPMGLCDCIIIIIIMFFAYWSIGCDSTSEIPDTDLVHVSLQLTSYVYFCSVLNLRAVPLVTKACYIFSFKAKLNSKNT